MNPDTPLVLVGPDPCPVTCPSCKAAIITKVDKNVSMKTHFMAMCLGVHGCCLLCLWIPYCLGSCRDSDHYCPNCSTYLGRYKR